MNNAERQARWRKNSSLRRVELYLRPETVDSLDALLRERDASGRGAIVESLIAETLLPVDAPRASAGHRPDGVPVKYIGQKPVKRDTICGTGLEWTRGQVIVVPREMAECLLRHPDVWGVGS